jgi:hypothetical protein
MADPVTFAQARLDEDETAAKSATDGPWYAVGNEIRGHDRTYAGGEPDILVVKHTWPQEAAHIVRHDPARALREVEAGRRILARYEDCLARMEDPDYPQGVARDQAREYEDFVLPNLLYRWADHPDYEPAWLPEGLD